MTESYFETVVKWNKAIDTNMPEEGYSTKSEGHKLGRDLVDEEYLELDEAETDEATADAIADLIWVLCGLAARLGYDLDAVWAEVKRANWAKLGGPRREDGKLLKPEGWAPPNITKALKTGRTMDQVAFPAQRNTERICRLGHVYLTSAISPGRCWCGESAQLMVVDSQT